MERYGNRRYWDVCGVRILQCTRLKGSAKKEGKKEMKMVERERFKRVGYLR